MQRSLGFTPEELAGRRVFDLIHDDLDDVMQRFGDALATGEPVPVTFRFRHRDGHYVLLNRRQQSRRRPAVRGVVVNRDVSGCPRRDAAEPTALRRLLIEQMPVGIIFTDPAGQVTNANPAALAILGSPSAAATSQFNVLRMDRLMRAGVSDAFRRVFDEHRIERIEIAYESHWGRRADMRVLIVPLFDQPGRLIGSVAILEDVTERARADREKAALLDIAREIGGSLDRSAILERVHRRVAELLPCDQAVTWIADGARGGLRGLAAHGAPGIAAIADRMSLEADHPLARAISSGRTVVWEAADAQPYVPVPQLEALGAGATIVVPLVVRGAITGAIAAIRRPENPPFAEADVQLFVGIARQVALVLGAAELHHAEQEEAAVSTALARVGQALISSLSGPEMLNWLCEVTAEALGRQRGRHPLLDDREPMPHRRRSRRRAPDALGPDGDAPLPRRDGGESRGALARRRRHAARPRVDGAVATVNDHYGAPPCTYAAPRPRADRFAERPIAAARGGSRRGRSGSRAASPRSRRSRSRCRASSTSSSAPTGSSRNSSRRCRTSCARR